MGGRARRLVLEGAGPCIESVRCRPNGKPRVAELTSVKLGSFRGQYTILFRNDSGLVHATVRGLNRVTEDLPDGRKRVVLQAPLDGAFRPDGMATVLHGLGLYVAAQSLGWPTAENVTAVFDRYPGP